MAEEEVKVEVYQEFERRPFAAAVVCTTISSVAATLFLLWLGELELLVREQRPLPASNRNRTGGNHASTFSSRTFDVWWLLYRERH